MQNFPTTWDRREFRRALEDAAGMTGLLLLERYQRNTLFCAGEMPSGCLDLPDSLSNASVVENDVTPDRDENRRKNQKDEVVGRRFCHERLDGGSRVGEYSGASFLSSVRG